MRGFPSIKRNGIIFISKRNVNKNNITDSDFIPVKMENDTVYYSGVHKPSVDSPTQIKLYEYYRQVNYIIHGHTYVIGAPKTKKYVPCGYVEEFNEIISIYDSVTACNFAINLLGHGCIILAKDIRYFNHVSMLARDFPEDMTNYL